MPSTNSKGRLQLLQRRHTLHQPARRPRILPAPLLHLCSRHRRRPGRPRRRTTRDVQNSYDPSAERGPSVTDQRQRLVAAISAEPHPFHRGQEFLGHIFNDWKISSLVNYGSGRPFSATVAGDPNQDGNDLNDRLPGYSRNAFTGPDYATTDLRLTKLVRLGERYKLNLTAESFNLFNRDNQRVTITPTAWSTTQLHS